MPRDPSCITVQIIWLLMFDQLLLSENIKNAKGWENIPGGKFSCLDLNMISLRTKRKP